MLWLIVNNNEGIYVTKRCTNGENQIGIKDPGIEGKVATGRVRGFEESLIRKGDQPGRIG